MSGWLLIASLLLRAQSAIVHCRVDRILPDTKEPGVSESELLGFYGATIRVTLKDSLGDAFVPTSWSGVSGDLLMSVAEPGTFEIRGPSGGSYTAVDDSDKSCDVILKPITKYFYYPNSGELYDYPSSAVQMTGGTRVRGEYYVDKDGSPIHLHPEALSSKKPSENWFKVESGHPANLEAEPDDSMANKNNYTPATPGHMITEDELAGLVAVWNDPFFWCRSSTVWVVPRNANAIDDKPKIDSSGKFPFGTAATVVKGTSTVVDVAADLPHCVISRAILEIPDVLPPQLPTPAPTTTSSSGMTTTSSQYEVESSSASTELSLWFMFILFLSV